jgi:hypothetical protein
VCVVVEPGTVQGNDLPKSMLGFRGCWGAAPATISGYRGCSCARRPTFKRCGEVAVVSRRPRAVGRGRDEVSYNGYPTD